MLAVSLSSGLVNTYIRVKCVVEEVVRYESWGVNCMFQDRKTAGSLATRIRNPRLALSHRSHRPRRVMSVHRGT